MSHMRPVPSATPAAVCLFLALLTLPPISSVALAQPPSPGTVEESLRPRPSQPGKDMSLPELPTLAPPRLTPPSDELRVRIARFTITGNTIFSEAELRNLIADREDAELTLTEIYGLADRLTEFYQAHGYSLTTVTVPAQRMLDGVLRLEVVEGKVGKLFFEGNQRYDEAFLANQLNLLAPGTILRFADLESEVLLLNDLPGLLARSVLMPGDAYGTTDINLRMEEKPVTANAVLDNQGRKVIGQWRLGADFTINNPFKYGDVLGLGYTHSQHSLLRQGRFSYGFPIQNDGTRLNLSYSRAEYDVGGDFTVLDIAGISETARMQISHPIIRSRRSNLSATIGGAHVLGQSDMRDIPLNDDTINFLEAGLNFSHRNASGGLANLSGLLATNFRNNPAGTDNEALPPRLELRGDYEHLFAQGWSAVVRGEAVLSNDSLPDSNKYSLGGPASVRGFVSSQLRGDQGAMGSLGIRRGLSFTHADLLLRGFIDGGEVHYEIPMADGRRSDSLASAGIGMTVSVAGKYTLDLQWATPIDGNDSGDGLNSPLWVTFTAMY
ncbi:MAG: BamA/TamA family outer membrane protein [Desulfobulbaceae bacterium]|nr:BamA/TamA family outer membrane protein [Desulfobulbaceae bacterium]HIJ90695.1 ShlB/FhaC/HecB family hemolysin secretion/activation protein [Deltaproteobacteria bacterium]